MIKIKTIKIIKFNFITFSLLLTPIIYAAADHADSQLLLNAAENGNFEELKNLIKRIVDPKTTNALKRTALTLSSKQGHFGIVQYLLKNYGTNPNEQDVYEPTLLLEATEISLMLASMNGHFDIVEYLLSRGAVNPNVKNAHGRQTPLMLASMNGHFNIVEHLLYLRNIDHNLQDNFGNTALAWAIKMNQREIVKMIFKNPKTHLHIVNHSGETTLMLASMKGHFDIVEYLLTRENVNPNTQNAIGQTALMLASMNGHFGIVKFLLKKKDTKLNLQDKSGNTALMWGIGRHQEEIVKILLEHPKTRFHTANHSGKTTLMVATRNNLVDIAKKLLKNVNNIDLQDHQGRTAFIHAIRGYKDNMEMIKLLSREGAKPNLPDSHGQTTLMYASYQGYEEIAIFLIDQYNHLDNQDKYKETALMYASFQGHEGIVKSLLQGKADPDLQDKHKQTALNYARTPNILKRLQAARRNQEMLKQPINQPKTHLLQYHPF